MDPETKTIILALLSIIISLFAIYFKEYQIIIISSFSITIVGYILFTYLRKIEKNEKEIQELRKSLKRTEDLIELKTEIKFLKNKLR